MSTKTAWKSPKLFPFLKKVIARKLLIIASSQFYHNLTKLKKLIYSCIINFIKKNDLPCENQFGFRKNSSTTFVINSTYDKFINNVDQNLHTSCLSLDLSKAFNAVDYEILLNKLYHNCGIRGKPLDILTSYLCNRYQCTNVCNFMSLYTTLSCWVPKGSCLGPLLFSLYLNDTPLIPNFDTTLFADDIS